jgi:hypothetical protein
MDKKMPLAKKILWAFLALILLASAGFVLWAETPPGPMPEAAAALEPDARVDVTLKPWLVFEPRFTTPSSGLIFYPGGRVDPASYAALARSLAEEGVLAVIVPMPLNLAVFAPGKAEQVVEAYPEIQNWVIAGHSLGGAMAANYIAGRPDSVQGLALLAAYPAASDSLAGQNIPVISIFASQDGLTTAEKIDASRALLPATTRYISIDGGNHAQFGDYGPQTGDLPATISRQKQQEQVIESLLNLFEQIKG